MTKLTEAINHRRDAAWVILLCFFASGMSSLVYQVVWVRELVLVFGATTFAVSTVLTSFMGGLALGSGDAEGLLQELAGLQAVAASEALGLDGALAGGRDDDFDDSRHGLSR